MLDVARGTGHFAPMEEIILNAARRPISLPNRIAAYAGTLLMVSAATIAGLLVAAKWGNATVVLLYLPPVLVAATYAGLRNGLFAALISALAFNYFFTVPYHTLFIHSPADIMTVAVLFLVAIACSHLAASVRKQADLAAAHALRNATIAGFARRLLTSNSEAAVAELTIGEIAKLFECRTAMFSKKNMAAALAVAPSRGHLNPGDIAAMGYVLESGEAAGRCLSKANEADWQFHPVANGQSVIAAVGLARVDGQNPVQDEQLDLLNSLLDQAALALERIGLEDAARENAALRELDKLRAALLASIGEDVKPRLNAIQAVVRALRRNGVTDKALLTELTGEVSKVDRFVDNLVDLAPGADRTPLTFGGITIDLYRRQVWHLANEVHLTPKEFALLAELAKHGGRVLSHGHLLRSIWGPAQEQHTDYLRVAIRALRQKLESDPAKPAIILNEPGVGYRLAMS